MKKKLFRSKTDRAIGGVAGGFAAYFDVDPIIVRLIFLALLFSGIGFPVYIIAWIFVPLRKGGGNDKS